MPSAVTVPNSPIFSPSIFCKSSASISSPRIPSRNLHGMPQAAPSSPPHPPPSSPLVIGGDAENQASGTNLKRKRPARINVPLGTLNFKVHTPNVAESVKEIEVEEDKYSVYCKRGMRGLLEDRYSAVVGLHGDPKKAVFGVFDGHGGAEAAEFASKNIDKNIITEVSGKTQEEVREAVRNAYLSTDSDFLKKSISSGTCCVTALIHEGDLVVSNAGDCRAVLSRGGVAEPLTSDHRPSRIDERERIETLGGYVDCCRGVWRIHGSLAVSRGIGDRHLKEWVTAEPETKVLRIEPKCEFLILASDGLWDKVSNQEAVDIARPLCVALDKAEPLAACKKLVELSIMRGSTDDISVLIAQLGCFVP